MHVSDEKIFELFELLDRLCEIEDEQLLGYFTNENIGALRIASVVLKDEIYFEKVLSQKRFIKVVQELCEAKKIWSAKLEETLARVASEFDRGESVQALWILNGFIRFCPSPYFRNIAEEMLGEYEDQ